MQVIVNVCRIRILQISPDILIVKNQVNLRIRQQHFLSHLACTLIVKALHRPNVLVYTLFLTFYAFLLLLLQEFIVSFLRHNLLLPHLILSEIIPLLQHFLLIFP